MTPHHGEPGAIDPALIGELHEILGPGGTLGTAYRLAVERTAPATGPTARGVHWQPVMNDLQKALSLVAGVLAGHDRPPRTLGIAEWEPCTRCGVDTPARIYDTPWHYTCWQAAGCPLAPVEREGEQEPARPAVAEPAPAAADDNADDHQDQEGRDPVEADWFVRRQRDRAQAATFDVDPDVERAHFAAAVRTRKRDATDDEVTAALAAWHTHVQPLGRSLRFVISPGYTGAMLYELLAAAHGTMVQPVKLADPLVWDVTRSSDFLRWVHFLNPEVTPVAGMAVTELDITAQFLGAAPSTDLGDGEPDLLDAVTGDWVPNLSRPGYVELAEPPGLAGLPAHARAAFAAVDAGTWLANPHAKYLAKDHGVQLHIGRAILWPAGDRAQRKPARYGRRLAVWAKEVREARLALTLAARADAPGAALALGVLKSMYAAFLGGMLRSEDVNNFGTLRPDWGDMLVTSAGSNTLRALDKLPDGVVPLGGMKDSVWFPSDAAHAPFRPGGLGYADQPGPDQDKPGKWHLNRWGVITDDLVRHHANGNVGLVRNAVIKADKARKAAA
ncbi:hypothetical protein [Amycolatopsis sp. NPDC054798]